MSVDDLSLMMSLHVAAGQSRCQTTRCDVVIGSV